LNLAEKIVFWAVAAGLIVLAGIYFFSHTISPELPSSWDYKDVVSILLSIVTVALTVLGIIIAIAAFWSYQKITEAAEQRAEGASERFLTSEAFLTRLDIHIVERLRNERQSQVQPNLDVSEPDGGGAGGKDEPWVDE